jgi:D-arabinose 1-dehydrogenase-like Zn-dependent alcohol dehydrogenase
VRRSAAPFNAIRRSDLRPGQTVASSGSASSAALMVSLAASAGARVIAVARKQSALDVAPAMGAAETVVMDDHRAIIARSPS